MKPHYLFLLLLFFLTSCASSTPAPTATPVPTATSMLTPIPTITPTTTPVPETWVAGIEDSGVELSNELFDLIKDQNPVLSAGGKQILNAETNKVLLEKKDGLWKWSTKSYSENSDIDKFQNPENFVPPEDLSYRGEYWKWAKTEIAPKVKEWFMSHEDQIIDGEDLVWTTLSDGFMIPYRFIDEDFSAEELPFNGKFVFHHTVLKFDQETTFTREDGVSITAYSGDEWLYTITPLFLYDKKTRDVTVVVAILEQPYENKIDLSKDWFMNRMNVTPLSTFAMDVSGFINPIVEKAFSESGLPDEEITTRMEQFRKGNFSTLDGFVVNTMITDHKVYR